MMLSLSSINSKVILVVDNLRTCILFLEIMNDNFKIYFV